MTSAGTWSSVDVHGALSELLGTALAPSLSPSFEWYLTRGAFFHNDAHYAGVLFGVWCVSGSPMDLVFPRLGMRLSASPGALAVFDPFEVHGVLLPGRTRYAAEDYADCETSVFIGFELALSEPVIELFGVGTALDAPILSSRTRIDAVTGAIV